MLGHGIPLKFRLLALRNSYLMGPEWLYSAVVSDADVARVLNEDAAENRPRSLSARVTQHLLPWFWPRITDAAKWARSTETEGWDPRNYLRSEPRPLLQRIINTTPTYAGVLDLGCNSGADLDLLRQQGFRHLYGVDAGRAALELFKQEFPETWQMAEVKHDIFQHYLQTAPTGFVDVLHSHGATIELVHPSFPVVRHMCRVTRRRILIQISEYGHSFPRKYLSEFNREGFLVTYRQDLGEQTIIDLHRA